MYAETVQESRFTARFETRQKARNKFAREVLAGLSAPKKSLPPVYFYDEIGSRLFEQICELPEYYITRTEHALLQHYAGEIVKRSEGNMALVELGSGSALKTRLLIEALIHQQGRLHYFPIDISSSILMESSRQLLRDFKDLEITAHVAEYNAGLHRVAEESFEQKMIIFLGSNIGNFTSEGALAFLRKVRRELRSSDYFLLSTDMQKERAVLEAAYDDAQGVTAEFNLNVLRRINRELAGEFDLASFSHFSFYNEAQSRIEMHLRSEIRQKVYIGKLQKSFSFGPGETIHTENSYKYNIAQLEDMFRQTGFRLARRWQDERRYFSLNLLAL